MFAIVLLFPYDVEAQSAEPDSIFLVAGGGLVVRIIGIKDGNVKIISPEGETQNLALDGIEKIVDSLGRVIYWRNRVSRKGFSEYLARSRGKKRIMLEVGTSWERRFGQDQWTQLTPRIGWLFSPSIMIELSGGRKNVVEDETITCYCEGENFPYYSFHSERKKNYLQVHLVSKFFTRTDLLHLYTTFGIGRYWDTTQVMETYFQEVDYNLNRTYFFNKGGFIFDGGFGLLFFVTKQLPVRVETRIEGWLTDFALLNVSIGISWRIPL